MKRRMTAVWILCLLLCTQWVAFAAQSEPVAAEPDLMRNCSLTVHLTTVAEEPVRDGQVQLVQAASLCEGPQNQYYELNAAFGALSFDPVATWAEPETANALAKIAQEGNLPCATAPVSEAGVAVFENLAPGLYLLMQTDEALVSYTAIPPCLVLVPEQQKDGSFRYDVDCYPKPVTEKPPTEVEFGGEKKIESKSGKAPSETEFSFVLTPDRPDQPMPKTSAAVVDPKTGAAVVTRAGAGAFSFGKLPIEQSDIGKTYRYTMHEIKGSALHFSYDVTVYTITVTVTDNGGAPQATVAIVDENSKSVDRAVFTNIYAPPEKPEIPRTGQLWWPVLLLAFCGLLLIAIGMGRRLRATRD